jgi:hypothetical protein
MKRTGVALSILLIAGVARADLVDIKFGGQIAADIRYRLGGEEIPPGNTPAPFPTQQKLLRYGFSRNENLIKAQLTLTLADRVKAVADVDFVWYGYSDVNDINSETLHERVDPYRLESQAAYVDVYKILPHLDLRIGRQVVVWGTADKFNPTNNLNTLDLSDPLLFGKALANQMIRLDYNPWRDLIITAVLVPIFRPAQLPRTAPLAVTQVQRPAPVQEDDIRTTLGQFAMIANPKSVSVYTLVPEPAIENVQFGLRVAGRLLGQDLSISYYYGRTGIPVPAWATNKPGGIVEVGVTWPRVHVLGFDMAGNLEKLGGIGYWIEAGVFFPQQVNYGLYNDDPALGSSGHDPITFETINGRHQIRPGSDRFARPVVVPSTPFLKLTVGLDYSWNKYLYTNLQYVYGFIDEFGWGKQTYIRPGEGIGGLTRSEARIGHYLVPGFDIKLFNDALLLRFFAAFKVPSIDDQGSATTPGHETDNQKFTAVLFPQIAWAVWDATELSLGAFIFLGDSDTKFGDPAAGASEIFMKARFTY